MKGFVAKYRIAGITLIVGFVFGWLLSAFVYPSIIPTQSIIQEFTPQSQVILEQTPIIKCRNVMSGEAILSPFVKVLVSPYYPTFSDKFKAELMTHEYLHILQARDKSIDIQEFHQAVQLWFNDFSQGLPTTRGNYTKFYLWFDLYNSGRYNIKDYPVEEYAYIGTMLSRGRTHDIPANIQAYYKGILN